MIQIEMLPDMTQLLDRWRVVGSVVRDGIDDLNITYTEASRTWRISLPTLNRLMNGQPVGARFLRAAEKGMDLPSRVFDLILDGDVDGVTALTGTIDEDLRLRIVRELGADVPPTPPKRVRKRA